MSLFYAYLYCLSKQMDFWAAQRCINTKKSQFKHKDELGCLLVHHQQTQKKVLHV